MRVRRRAAEAALLLSFKQKMEEKVVQRLKTTVKSGRSISCRKQKQNLCSND